MGQRFRTLTLFGILAGLGGGLWLFLGRGVPDSPEGEPPSASEFLEGRVRVEVLNTGGTPGAAGAATETLRDQGFDVVYYGNAETYSSDSSVVLDRVGDLRTARSVAEALGILEARSEMDSTLLVDVTVRLGPEWSDPRTPMKGDRETQAWWDPRRLFQHDNRPRSETLTGP